MLIFRQINRRHSHKMDYETDLRPVDMALSPKTIITAAVRTTVLLGGGNNSQPAVTSIIVKKTK